MAQENEILKQGVKQKGFFNYGDVYEFCFDWLTDNGYQIAEKKYEEKLSADGKNIEIEWVGMKKINDYLRFKIKLDWKIVGMKDAEIERDGKKESTNRGTLGLKFTATLEKDYEDKWEKKPFWKFMRGVYDKYVLRTTIDEYEGKVAGEAMEYIKQVKSFLQLGK